MHNVPSFPGWAKGVYSYCGGMSISSYCPLPLFERERRGPGAQRRGGEGQRNRRSTLPAVIPAKAGTHSPACSDFENGVCRVVDPGFRRDDGIRKGDRRKSLWPRLA